MPGIQIHVLKSCIPDSDWTDVPAWTITSMLHMHPSVHSVCIQRVVRGGCTTTATLMHPYSFG